MRDPIGAIVPGTAVTLITGNQFQGGGNPGNQLQTGSALVFKRAADATWTLLPLIFLRTLNNNKYYAATIVVSRRDRTDALRNGSAYS
jgi:galactose oxidase